MPLQLVYPFKSTPLEDIPDIVANLRKSFDDRGSSSLEWRMEQLSRLLRLLKDDSDGLQEALYKDLHRSKAESFAMEVGPAIIECQEAIAKVKEWMQYEKVPTNLLNIPGSSYIKPDPLGVVLIMAPWNYPISLIFSPLIGALAAGNSVLLRPGTNAFHSSEEVARVIAAHFSPDVVNVVKGDHPVTTEVLKQKFDLIFFTGGQVLGKVVAKAAAETLTPVVLELGGKSPAVVCEDADVTVTAKRIAWATFVNAGQTCVRPDYGLVHKDMVEPVVNKMIEQIKLFYTFGDDISEPAVRDLYTAQQLRELQNESLSYAVENPPNNAAINDYMSKSPYLARIVNDLAFDRIVDIIEKDRQFIRFGGNFNKNDRYVQPTIMVFDTFENFKSSECMKAEIFGPIFPIVPIENFEQALEFIRSRPKSLASYAFTNNSSYKSQMAERTSSGSLVFNDCIVQLSNGHLPFGGVGESGTGAYHGKFSFETFSHQKPILYRSFYLDASARYPPYTLMDQMMLKATTMDTSWLTIHWAPALALTCAAVYASLPYVLPTALHALNSLNEWLQRK